VLPLLPFLLLLLLLLGGIALVGSIVVFPLPLLQRLLEAKTPHARQHASGKQTTACSSYGIARMALLRAQTETDKARERAGIRAFATRQNESLGGFGSPSVWVQARQRAVVS
jgi:hypothetical protein